jgi:hypothetical protein
MTIESPIKDKLSQMSTQELKSKLLELTQGRDADPLNKKVLFYKNELEPLFQELSYRNPFPVAEEQVPLVLGIWTPVWSTIPFHDMLPGRVREQSYQIFRNDGYYANIARYAPGHQRSFLQKLPSILFAYDFMVLQKFEVQNGRWQIQNIGIEQAFRLRGISLDIDKAESWFRTVVQFQLQSSSHKTDVPRVPELLDNLSESTGKKLKKIFQATPQFEHLYIDGDFRLVKTQREAKQRPSYTIATRKK